MSSSSPTYIPAQIQTPDLELLWSIGKGDMKQTEQAYKVGNVRYEKPPVQLKEERWYAQVQNANTGEFIQPEQLRALGLVTPDYPNNNKYPMKTLTSLIRLKTNDAKEWLLSRQYWIGLDRLGNDVPQSMNDKENWLKPAFQYKQILPNNDPLAKKERKTIVTHFTNEYTLPFTPKDADKLYSLRNPGRKVSLVLKNGSEDTGPRDIPKYIDFRDREFDELYEFVSTPKFNLDRSIQDNLEQAHIK